MAEEKLSIEMILMEVEELVRSGREPEMSTPVGKPDTVIGNLRFNPRLMALLLLVDLTVRAMHSARATCERRMSVEAWGGATWEGSKEDFRLVRQLEAKRDMLHTLFYYELKTWLDEWDADNIGVRQELDVVTYSKNKKPAEVLKRLLRDGQLDDLE
jgi:hypothetical protein